MLKASIEIIKPNAISRYHIIDEGKPITCSEAISRLKTDLAFRTFFTHLLAKSPFSAFRWETPALSSETKDQDFQFVLLNTPTFIDRRTDVSTFKSKFTKDDTNWGVIHFANLGGDATMIVPSPRTGSTAYGHLAAFLRHAPINQTDAFWRVTGEEVEKKLSTTPIWISTAGIGVAWLHLRLDSHPNYYGYLPYKQTTELAY